METAQPIAKPNSWLRDTLSHLIGWGAYLLLPVLVGSTSLDNHLEFLARPFPIYHNISNIILFYLNYYLLIPVLLYKRGWLPYVGTVIAVVTLYTLVGMEMRTALIPANLVKTSPGGWARVGVITYLFTLAVSTSIRLISDRTQEMSKTRERENETLKSELMFLRSQISPHFMFNILNSVVALARKKSDLLEPVLLKLSSLLRYMLYDSDQNLIPVDREIEYLKAYVELQQMRLGDTVPVTLELPAVTDPTLQIAPMLLIPFVENAFKHGTGYSVKDPVLNIRLETRQKEIRFSVRNHKPENPTEAKDGQSGIGLANVKRRLELLYGDRHTLTILDGPDTYDLSLTLHLN